MSAGSAKNTSKPAGGRPNTTGTKYEMGGNPRGANNSNLKNPSSNTRFINKGRTQTLGTKSSQPQVSGKYPYRVITTLTSPLNINLFYSDYSVYATTQGPSPYLQSKRATEIANARSKGIKTTTNRQQKHFTSLNSTIPRKSVGNTSLTSPKGNMISASPATSNPFNNTEVSD